jgi:DNA replication protein
VPPFSGFQNSKAGYTPIPVTFFSELLPEIDDLGELRLTLQVFSILDAQEGEIRYILLEDFLEDDHFSAAFGKSTEEIKKSILSALERALRRGTILSARSGDEDLYFLNSPRGRAALESLSHKGWNPESGGRKMAVTLNRPNIYALYEQNIGPLTPIIAQELEEADKQYSVGWVEDAIKVAVTRNARTWRFIDAVLRSWKEKGRDEKDQRSTKQDRKRDSEGEYGDYILH